MIIQDLRHHVPGTRIRADLCIVGAGPAGLVIAEELSGRGLKIVVLESGDGEDTEDGGADLNAIESVGRPRVEDQRLVRRRTVGGASQFWYGRVATLDAEDLLPRSWVPDSGWPIDRGTLEPYWERSAAYFDLPFGDNTDPETLADLGLPSPGTDPRVLRDYRWLLARHGRFGNRPVQFGARARTRELPGVVCITNATVTQILLDERGGAVSGLEVTAPDARIRFVEAGITVLAAGGIENARLLLASNRRSPDGVGNASDQVGRYLMDHLRATVADVDSTDSRTIHALSAGMRRRRNGRTVALRPGFALSQRMQRDREVLNAAAWVDWTASATDPWQHLTRPSNLAHPRHYAAVAVRGVPVLARGGRALLRGRMPEHAIESATVECWLEQGPHADSRITLSRTLDRFRMPISRIDWRFGALETRTVELMAETVRAEFVRLGLPQVHVRPELSGGALHLVDVAHPMGTTRMSSSPSDGVVDASCRVHDVANLYIAGGSVFPTGGHANPTHTILALAIRLADHLRSRIATADAPPAPSRQAVLSGEQAPPESERPLVLVTGASGKIGSRVVERLLDEGYAVRALTSRAGREPGPHLEWRVHDLRQDDLDFDTDVHGATAVVHLGAELSNTSDMWRTNVEATAALGAAAERTGVGTFCYVSSISVYGSPRRRSISEETSVLSTAVDRPQELVGTTDLRTYARTKLAGEQAIARQARSTRYVVLRPTVVVDDDDLRALAAVSAPRRAVSTFRRTQHVYVDDVAAAVLWAVRDAGPGLRAGETAVYNVADETDTKPHFGQAFGGRRSSGMFHVPGLTGLARLLDIGLLRVKYHSRGAVRFPLGQARVSAAKLRAAGFRPAIGMDRVRSSI